MQLDPRRMLILLEVARRGGVMKAAEALHLTPSAVSQQLGHLEREVGLALIDRSQRSATLTPAGRVLATYADRLDEELAEAKRELTTFTERLAGPVVIGAFHTVIRHLLVPAMTVLKEKYPEITPIIKEIWGPPALKELRLGGLDMTIGEQDSSLAAAPDLASMAVREICEDEYRIVIPPGWALPYTMEDLKEVPWITGQGSDSTRQALDRLARIHGFTPHQAHACTEYPAVLALVASGHGVAIVSSLALRDLPTGQVTVTEIPDVGARRLDAITRVSRTRSGGPDPVQAVVIQALLDVARPAD